MAAGRGIAGARRAGAALRNGAAGIGAATERWRGPVAFGISAAAALWAVWYFTKAPCTMTAAGAGQCNPGALAGYINHQIIAQCMLVGMAAATLKGGYNEIMLNRERKRADAAEERLAEERKRNDERLALITEEQRKRNDEQMGLMTEERKRSEERLAEERKRNDELMVEERKRIDALLEGFHAERIQNRAAQQEILSRIADTQAILAQLLQQRQNGNGRPAAED